jgi:lysozyme
MKASINARKIKEYFEAREYKAYPDPGSKDGKPWTIGVGHTGPEVVKGLVWNDAQINAAFENDSAKFESAVRRLVTVTLNQFQFDALVCLVFNIGTQAFKDSTLLRKLNAGDYSGAGNEFLRWCRNDGKKMLGLYRRRMAEKLLFGGESADFAIRQASKINSIPE